ncbi:hypothetical protein [Gemmata sp.]|uniref:hypothetical protein n=1 Tax=Gemmata sp. TaxID=1914242 RepID=UPI003F7288F0
MYDWTPGTAEFRVVADVRTARFRENWAVVEKLLKGRGTAVTHKDLLADWPADRERPSPHHLYEWLGRAFEERKVERYGAGTRRDPYTFRLPGPPGGDLDDLRARLGVW